MIRVLLVVAVSVLSLKTLAQSDYRQQYFNGKNFFREGKYNLAMEAFKQAIPYDKNNMFSEYASFYYSLSAYNQGYLSVSRDMLGQIKKLYPAWDKMDEVNFWLGKIHMDEKDYFQGLKVWEGIKNAAIRKDIQGLKAYYLREITDVETLVMISEEYPKDRIVGRALATVLASNLANPETRNQFETTIKKFGLDRGDFINEAPPTYFKDVYSVSVLYPFMLPTLDPSPSRKRNQLILDLYEGMRLATDTMRHQGIKIDLRAYDTERKSVTIKKILETEELKNTDLIVGPFFPDENALVQEFSIKNRINVFKPFTNNLEMIGVNEFGFLFQPSYETIGRKSAEFLAGYVKRRKNCLVFQGMTKKDSLLAASFKARAIEAGLNVVSVQAIHKEGTGRIINMLATPTEFDQWKKPIEFTLKKDSLGCIYVASDDPLLYSKVVSSIETRGDSIVVVGAESWLEQTSLDYDKYQALGIILPSPNYMSASGRHYQAFVRKYIRTHGQPPSNYAKLGYELMLFLGNSLKKNGVYFQEAFNKGGPIPGFLSEGFNYQFSHDNQLVPFVRFRDGELVVVENK